MIDGGSPLVQWSSYSIALTELLTKEDDEPNFYASSQKILGVEWTPDTDEFAFHSISFSSDLIVTKRVLLSLIARVFDPLGFLSPFVMTLKILFQPVWQKGLDWDCELVSDAACSWGVHGAQSAERTPELEDPAPLFAFCLAWTHWKSPSSHHVRCFGESIRLCVAYLRTTETGEASFVMSRTRVAPLKRLTVPKLELMGALLACRVLKTVCKAWPFDEHEYALLFTCAVVRAVHLELTSSLSIPEFCLPFVDFVLDMVGLVLSTLIMPLLSKVLMCAWLSCLLQILLNGGSSLLVRKIGLPVLQ